MIKRIALIGPESSGKTTLAKLLAAHYHTVFVPEYARDYMAGLHRAYTFDDILFSAKAQADMEKMLLPKANKILFSDTELIVAKVWSEDVFKKVHPWISDMINKSEYDLYLLTKPDLPWEEDPVRENPHRREYFYNLYLKELEKRKFNFTIISGKGGERFNNALKAVKKLI